MYETEKKILQYLDLSSLVTLACTFFHLTTDEAGLHQAEIARDIAVMVHTHKFDTL